jgi:homoserine kinase type II
MAVFTELSDEDRVSITAAYGMTSLTSVIGIADGDRETTYLFRCGEGEFIVTLFENGAEPLDLEKAFETMETLYDNGVPCPRPMRTMEGLATFQAAARLVAVVGFVSGSATNDASSARSASLGRVMAQIHTSLERSPIRAMTGLPTGSVHGALDHQNVFFLGEDVSGIINFRLRHDDVLISEVADVLVGWASQTTGALDTERARALLQGYQEIRKLTKAEREALPGFVMASAARRYASVTDRTCLPGIAMLAYKSVDPYVLTYDPGPTRS